MGVDVVSSASFLIPSIAIVARLLRKRKIDRWRRAGATTGRLHPSSQGLVNHCHDRAQITAPTDPSAPARARITPPSPHTWDPAPSTEDLRITGEIAAAGALLDIGLLDHIVIGHGRWVSLRALGACG